MEQDSQIAFWTTVAQVAAALSIAIVLEARGAARRWRKSSRVVRVLESITYAVAGFLASYLIFESVLAIRRVAPDRPRDSAAEIIASFGLASVALIVVWLPVARVAAKANGAVILRVGKLVFFPVLLRRHRRLDRLEADVRTARAESDRLVARCAAIRQTWRAEPLGIDHFDSAVEWGFEALGPLLTLEPDEVNDDWTVSESHELAHALRRYDFTRDPSILMEIRERLDRIWKHFYVETRLMRLVSVGHLDRIQAVRDLAPMWKFGEEEIALIKAE
jgi:hypothetical protein